MRQTDPALLRSFLHHCLIQFVVVLFSLLSFSISLCFESVYVFAPLFGSLGLSLCMCGCSGVHGCWKCRVLKNNHTQFFMSANVSPGIPQGSVLGPALFTLLLTSLNIIITEHTKLCHCFVIAIQVIPSCVYP